MRENTAGGAFVNLRTRSEGEKVRVTVTDTGIGISEEVLPHIFEPFQQGEAAKARRFGGLGLGLSIARGLVEAHGGTIVAESDGPGHGAVLTVDLPILAADAADAETPVPGAVPGAPHKGLQVLLVEDYEDTRRILSALIHHWGHHRGDDRGPVAPELEYPGGSYERLRHGKRSGPHAGGWFQRAHRQAGVGGNLARDAGSAGAGAGEGLLEQAPALRICAGGESHSARCPILHLRPAGDGMHDRRLRRARHRRFQSSRERRHPAAKLARSCPTDHRADGFGVSGLHRGRAQISSSVQPITLPVQRRHPAFSLPVWAA